MSRPPQGLSFFRKRLCAISWVFFFFFFLFFPHVPPPFPTPQISAPKLLRAMLGKNCI